MASIHINPEQFWDLYFRNLFLQLERKNGLYTGEIFAEPDQAQPPLELLRDVPKVQVEVSFGSLQEHNYSADGRFARITQIPASVSEAYEAVIAGIYPFREPAPFGKQRMAELFTQIRGQFLLSTNGELSLADLEQTLSNMVENHTPALNQPIAALAWFLGERRERSSSAALLFVVQNSSFAPYARHQLHFTPVDAAFSALWKVNDKARLWDILEMMRYTSESGRRKFAPLFERLLSTTELLSFEHCGSDYLESDFWASKLEPGRNFTAADWDQYDADSLFWEIRYLAVLRLPATNSDTFRKLAIDEVGTVRGAVHARFGRKAL